MKVLKLLALCKSPVPREAEKLVQSCIAANALWISGNTLATIAEIHKSARVIGSLFAQHIRLYVQPLLSRDPESLEDIPLVPGFSKTENALRWGFIKKVYGIISAQLLVTIAASVVIYLVPQVQNFVLGSPTFQIAIALLPLIGLIPLYCYQNRHPWNLVILAAWTVCLSFGVGTACTAFAPHVVIEALCITAAIVASLTSYAFWASRKGKDFTYLGPILVSSLMALVAWSFIQLFFPVSDLGQSIFALFGALVFAGFLVFDTANLIQNYDLDQYIWASVNLYLDILNLFLKILQLLGRK